MTFLHKSGENIGFYTANYSKKLKHWFSRQLAIFFAKKCETLLAEISGHNFDYEGIFNSQFGIKQSRASCRSTVIIYFTLPAAGKICFVIIRQL
jgi:hypothetical protein